MNIKLEEFNNDHIEDSVTLFLNVFSKPPWNDQWKSTESAKHYIMDIVNTPGFRGFVANINQRPVGVILGHIVKWWQGDEYFIKEFFVDLSLQGKGIGKQLDAYMNNRLLDDCVENIILLTERHTDAFEFYKKKGYNASDQTVFMVRNMNK